MLDAVRIKLSLPVQYTYKDNGDMVGTVTEYAVDLFKATGKILENVPADEYSASDLSDTDKAVIEAVITSYENAPARPLFTEWGQVWDTWKNGVLSWNNTQPADAEAAYGELKSSFDAMMAGFN